MAAAEEKYMLWLEHMDVPVDKTVDIEKFQKWLEDELAEKYTDERKDALWGTIEAKFDYFIPKGATPVGVEFPWGSQLRFGVKGYRGLFGLERTMELIGEE